MNGMRYAMAVLASALGLLLLSPLLVIGLPIVAATWAMGKLSGALEPTVMRWPQIFQFDPLLGWTARPNLDGHVLEDRHDVFHVVTDKYGWAGKATLAESEVVVLGDSHAWGYSVDHGRAFFNQNAALPIKTIGVPGYNMVQEFLLLEQVVHQLKGKLVVWFVYVGNDLSDNLTPDVEGYRTPFLRQLRGQDGWEIVTRHLSPGKWKCSDNRKLQRFFAVHPALHSETYYASRAYAACEFLLACGARLCRDAGADLLVMSIPSFVTLSDAHMQAHCAARSFTHPTDRELPDRRLGDICRRLNVPFETLSARLTIADYHEQDDHWTEAGHRKVADVLSAVHLAWKRGIHG